MQYLYTTEPDELCHEIEGVYGRPVHEHHVKKLLAKGWKRHAKELRSEEATKEEKAETEADQATQDLSVTEQLQLEAIELGIDIYKADGSEKHHKTLAKEIKEAQ